jgi:hypothetical protein
MNLFITAILISAPIFMVYYFKYPGADFQPIYIDGDFDDWADKDEYIDSIDTQNNPNIDITKCKVYREDLTTSFYIEVEGEILKGQKDERGKLKPDTVRVFIDTDKHLETGYIVDNIGADYMIEIQGKKGKSLSSPIYKFDPNHRAESPRENNDWNGWKQLDDAEVVSNNNKLETQYNIPYYADNLKEDENNDQILAIVQTMDRLGNLDTTEQIMSNLPELLLVKQKNIAPDILIDDITDMLELEITSQGTDITIETIIISQEGGGSLSGLPSSIFIEKDSTEKYTVKLDTSNIAPSSCVSLKIDSEKDIKITNNDMPVILSGTGASAYVKTSPDKIVIDGAFGDWNNVEMIEDIDSRTVNNLNVNISNYAVHELDANISFYLDVKGSILKGSKFPLDPHQFFEDIQERYHISVGLDEINNLTNLPPRTGEDSLYIFLDTDHNYETGFSLDWFPIGADSMIEIWGQEGIVKKSILYEYAGIGSQLEWRWSEPLGQIDTAVDDYRLESQINLQQLGVKEKPSVYFHIVDWSYGGDASQLPIYAPDQIIKELDSEFLFEGGVRGNTKYLLINELIYDSSQISNQFIEIANPTMIDLGEDFRIYRIRGNSETEIIIIPHDIPSNSYQAFTPNNGGFGPGDKLILKDAHEKILDIVIIPHEISSGDSYQRYRDSTDYMPVDTGDYEDFFTRDFYISEFHSINSINPLKTSSIPEFHEILIPIISIIFIALVIKKYKNNSKKKI